MKNALILVEQEERKKKEFSRKRKGKKNYSKHSFNMSAVAHRVLMQDNRATGCKENEL